jgi:Ca2+/Na+ antiporter
MNYSEINLTRIIGSIINKILFGNKAMAIVNCSDCGNKISDAARFCIYCGKPISSNSGNTKKRKVGFLFGAGILFFPIIFSWFTLRNGYSTKLRAVSLAWLSFVVLFLLAIGDNGESRREKMAPSFSSIVNRVTGAIDQDPQFSTSASDIASAYHEDAVAADMKFKGKRFRVIGVIKDINKNLLANPYLVLDGGDNIFSDPQFDFDKSDIISFAHLRKAMRVTLICTGQGDIVKTPIADNCSMEKAQ